MPLVSRQPYLFIFRIRAFLISTMAMAWLWFIYNNNIYIYIYKSDFELMMTVNWKRNKDYIIKKKIERKRKPNA